jgi:hypothetical protein
MLLFLSNFCHRFFITNLVTNKLNCGIVLVGSQCILPLFVSSFSHIFCIFQQMLNKIQNALSYQLHSNQLTFQKISVQQLSDKSRNFFLKDP